MVTHDIVLNKHNIFASKSYLFNIVKIIDKKKKSNLNVASFKELLKGKKFLFIGEYRKHDPVKERDNEFGEIEDAADQICEVADAMSVHTEEKYFCGNDNLIEAARKKCKKPIIERDFVVSPLQMYHAKIVGASAMSLVSRILTLGELKEYKSIADGIGIEIMVEVSSEEDLEKALKAGFNIILLSSFDYDKMENDLEIIPKLKAKIPDNVTVFADCPAYDSETIAMMKKSGIRGMFLSSDLIRHKDIRKRINDLRQIYGTEGTLQVC